MLLCFRSFSRIHGISKGALERSLSTNLREINSLVSTSFRNDFHSESFSIPFSIQDAYPNIISSPLILKSSLRRIKNVFTSIIWLPLELISRYSINRVLFLLRPYAMTSLAYLSHQARQPFYISTLSRQEDPASQENYASKLYQVMIMHLLKVGRTFCELEQMVILGRVHFTFFQNVFSSVWKIEGRKVCFRWLAQSFIPFALINRLLQILPESLSIYIKWPIYHRLQQA